MMPEFYYQIKGKADPDNQEGYFGGHSTWVFPPIFSGKVQAENKKEAKLLIEDEYGREFPLRVLANDLDSNEFLLSIKEITDKSTRKIFEENECEHCKSKFKVIDHYNNANSTYKGHQYCSDECKRNAYEVKKYEYDIENANNGSHIPVIYKITHLESGMCYIGKTTQAFTLRWYQHFFQGGKGKFHTAIRESELIDWKFHVIEVVKITSDKFKTKEEVDRYILERESVWIKTFDSIENGYNTVISLNKNSTKKKKKDKTPKGLFD